MQLLGQVIRRVLEACCLQQLPLLAHRKTLRRVLDTSRASMIVSALHAGVDCDVWLPGEDVCLSVLPGLQRVPCCACMIICGRECQVREWK